MVTMGQIRHVNPLCLTYGQFQSKKKNGVYVAPEHMSLWPFMAQEM